MNRALLRSLEQPRDVSRRWWIVYISVAVLFVCAFGIFICFGGQYAIGLPLVATAHAVAMGIAYGVVSFLFFTQARGDSKVGYLILGFAFGVAGLIWAWFPYFFPNGLSYAQPAVPAVGDGQSAAALYLINRWTVALGVVAAAIVLRRPDALAKRRHVSISAVVVAVAFTSVAILGWAALGAPGMPPFYDGDATTPTRSAILIVLFAMCVGVWVILMLARLSRSGSVLSRWLLTLTVLTFVEAGATPFAPRYTVNWLAIRWLSLIGTLVLLLALLWQLNLIQRSTARAADLDELTGALSRSAFVRVISDHLRAPASIRSGTGVIWVDLDQFRLVNAAAGAPAGDAFLRECYARLCAFAPAVDVVARIGGDEFALITRVQNRADLLERGMQISESVSRPLEVADARIMAAASVGCAWIDDSVDSAEEALRRAFAAMQSAKESGGDTAQIYSPEVDERAETELQWRHRLALAIREESFVNAYQPIFDTASGKPVAVEALIRLVDGDRLIAAGEFIAQAEASGQIIGIGRIGLQRLINDLPALMAAPTVVPLRVSFNLSVLQLADPVVIGMLLKPPLQAWSTRLVVEVTESFELSASTTAHDNLLRLVRAGYRTAIDDFGAGFSNFVQLEEIGRHIIKLDRSLIVRAGTREPSSLSVLSAAFAVARSLGSEVLAEGVETAEEFAIVRELGIQLVQGYRFARPMPLAETLAFLEQPAQVDDAVLP